ncbi:hypothetical protein O6H91_13G005100 [Diphasiastrum complanatum]|uniref:Uncharacterized protein n=1 Tax=Diphasiastrum complanatum TaxID=34168 RepID=A0ACC2BS05_DIPCM|nr:hypothetical protein O6H91_13G005100 [Diphasiastrum complanatum]
MLVPIFASIEDTRYLYDYTEYRIFEGFCYDSYLKWGHSLSAYRTVKSFPRNVNARICICRCSSLVHPNACEASLTKPMDRSSSFDRQSFGSLSRGDKGKAEIGMDWQKSSTALAPFQSATFSSMGKHRSLGWHGEGRRHSRNYAQSREATSLCGVPSFTGRGTFGNRHHERDLKSLADFSSATHLVTDNSSTDNERSIPAAISSPRKGKDLVVTTDIDQLLHPSLAVALPIDTYLSSRRSGFLETNSLEDCISYSTKLEARLDRYRQINSVVSKDPPSDWKSQERLYAPLLSPPPISPSSCDESNHPLPRKRPRLGWGQGLAKYEKKKVVEIEKVAHFESPKNQNRANLEIYGVPGICSSTGLTISTVCDRDIEKCISSDVSSKRESVKLEIAPMVCIEAFSVDAGNSSGQCGRKLGSIQNVFSARKDDFYLDFTGAPEQTSSENKMVETFGYPLAHGAFSSMEIILLNIEKVELEVDSIKKELVKLNFQIQSPDTNNLTDNECGAQGAGYPKSPVFSDPQSNSVSNDENFTKVCKSSLAKKCTLNAIQTSDGFDICFSDTLAGVLQLERDALQQKRNCDNLEAQSLIYESVKPMDIFMKSIDSVPEIFLLLSNIPGQQNFYLHNQESLLNSRKSGALSNFCEAIINENQEQANDAAKTFSHLLPSSLFLVGGKLYDSPEGSPNWFHNKEFHQRSKEELKEQLERHKKVLRFKEQLLAFRYQALSKSWKQEQFGMTKKKHRSKAVQKYDTEQRNGYMLNNQRSSSRLQLLSSGTAKDDTLSDELPSIKKFSFQSRSEKGSLKMPAMIIDEKERLSRRFVTRNALVEDPVASEQERKTLNPWTLEEEKVFLEKLCVFSKNFAKIASYLPQKTVADCIEFYYSKKKLGDFEKVLRRQKQPKKRRDYTQGSHSYLGTTSIAKRFCDLNDAVKAFREEADAYWSESERQFFLDALKLYGKDFRSIARHVGTKTVQQCKVVFRKILKRPGLEKLLELYSLKSQGDHEDGMCHLKPTSKLEKRFHLHCALERQKALTHVFN